MKGKFYLTLLASALAITIGTSAPAVAQDKGDGVTEKARYLPTRQSKETIAARQRFFGVDNVNPRTGAVRADRVIMSWVGVSTFAAAFNGHVIMLDGYL